jgi:hypothetical protein
MNQVVLHEGGNKVVPMVVALMTPQLQRIPHLPGGLLKQVWMQLQLQELI